MHKPKRGKELGFVNLGFVYTVSTPLNSKRYTLESLRTQPPAGLWRAKASWGRAIGSGWLRCAGLEHGECAFYGQ